MASVRNPNKVSRSCCGEEAPGTSSAPVGEEEGGWLPVEDGEGMASSVVDWPGWWAVAGGTSNCCLAEALDPPHKLLKRAERLLGVYRVLVMVRAVEVGDEMVAGYSSSRRRPRTLLPCCRARVPPFPLMRARRRLMVVSQASQRFCGWIDWVDVLLG